MVSAVLRGLFVRRGEVLDSFADFQSARPGRFQVRAPGSLGPDGSESARRSIRVAGQVVLQG